MSFDDFMQDTPASLRWLIAVAITVGLTVVMVRLTHDRALAIDSKDAVAADARKHRIAMAQKAADKEAEATGTEPAYVTEPPLPPDLFNLSGRLLGLVATAFVFLLAFTFSNFWQNSKAALSATQAEAAYWTQASVMAEPIPAELGGDQIRSAIADYRTSVTDAQWPMMQRGDSQSAYAEQLTAGLAIGSALLAADQAGASKSVSWDALTSATSNMLEQGRYRVDALPGRAAPGAVAVVCLLGVAMLALTAIFQPARLGANLVIMGLMAAIVATLLFFMVETTNPYVGSAAVQWPISAQGPSGSPAP